MRDWRKWAIAWLIAGICFILYLPGCKKKEPVDNFNNPQKTEQGKHYKYKIVGGAGLWYANANYYQLRDRCVYVSDIENSEWSEIIICGDFFVSTRR